MIVGLLLTTTPSVPAEGDYDGLVKSSCLIQPKMVLKLGTPVPGLISDVLVDRGVMVKKGDIIAKLESGVEEAAAALAKLRASNVSGVRSATAKLEFQKREMERKQELDKRNSIARSRADEATTTAKVAESDLHEATINLQLAELEHARANEVLKQRVIRSPISGVIVERSLGPGEYAFDQAHLVTVSQIDPLNVEIYLPLSQIGNIRPGMIAEIHTEYPVGGKYFAKVVVVDRVVDAASGTIGVRLEMPNPDYAIPAGQKCQAVFRGAG
jgi:RND family efflux transporter MFP subunit